MAVTTLQGQPAAPAAEVDIAAITLQVLEGKTTVGEQRGLSAKQLEAVYAMAYNFYNQKKFADAEKAFRFLVFYNHLDRRFWKGLGASLHLQKDYEGAVQAYAMMSLLDIDDPEAPMHAADCYIALGNREATLSALSAARHFSEGKPQYARIHERAQALLDRLDKNEAKPATHG